LDEDTGWAKLKIQIRPTGIRIVDITGDRNRGKTMLVILANEQVLSTEQVCPGCLLANRQGLPRWREGKLGCGYSLGKREQNQPPLYQCQMGFKIAELDSKS
jgi:hypothetical protein